jgi:hypothetical protein
MKRPNKFVVFFALFSLAIFTSVSSADETPKWMTDSVIAGADESDPPKCSQGLLETNYSSDRNYDGTFTISDLSSIFTDILTFPNDLLKRWTYGTEVGTFFEVRCSKTSGVAFFFSTIFMLFGVVPIVVTFLSAILDPR